MQTRQYFSKSGHTELRTLIVLKILLTLLQQVWLFEVFRLGNGRLNLLALTSQFPFRKLIFLLSNFNFLPEINYGKQIEAAIG